MTEPAYMERVEVEVQYREFAGAFKGQTVTSTLVIDRPCESLREAIDHAVDAAERTIGAGIEDARIKVRYETREVAVALSIDEVVEALSP